MRVAIVIPARYGSTRFPGKPLTNILGKSLLQRMWNIAKAVPRVDTVLIATDDQRIVDHAQAFGAQVQLTSNRWSNGSERILEALELSGLSPDVVVNLQGDAALTPPDAITALLDALRIDSEKTFSIATPCVQLTAVEYNQLADERQRGITNGTMVTFDKYGKALYFSKALIPYLRNPDNNSIPVYRHIGLYAFRYAALQKYGQLKPTPLEMAEGLEQLRAIENNIPINVIIVNYHGRTHWSIDYPEDVAVVEKIIQKEGELVPVIN